MTVLLIIGLSSLMMGIISLFSYADYLGAGVWGSVGLSLILMTNVGIDRFLLFTGHGLLSIKVIFLWVTLLIFITLFTYKILKDTGIIT
ncbi:hypothetical protein [Nodularia chucula]|uniref:hypothetical protein n=1 Tax=Nodularia chucula TaxID=3093667 RepID=UPI0039C6AFE2